jgi:hypothetical protein
MTQAVIRMPVIAKARVKPQVILCGVYGGKSGLRTGISLSASFFPGQYHHTNAPYSVIFNRRF